MTRVIIFGWGPLHNIDQNLQHKFHLVQCTGEVYDMTYPLLTVFCRCVQLVLFATNFQEAILNGLAALGAVSCEYPLDLTASIASEYNFFNTCPC